MTLALLANALAPSLPPRFLAFEPQRGAHMISWLELWAGLDVQALALSALPDETLRELLRLRGSWSLPKRKLV